MLKRIFFQIFSLEFVSSIRKPNRLRAPSGVKLLHMQNAVCKGPLDLKKNSSKLSEKCRSDSLAMFFSYEHLFFGVFALSLHSNF
jgi:hypothetical protein